MIDERYIDFQLHGRLSPEKFAELAQFLAQTTLTDLVEITREEPALQEAESKYNTEYLDLVYPSDTNEDMYLVTPFSFARFFKQNVTIKNYQQVQRAWEGLLLHFSVSHTKRNPHAKSCNCPLKIIREPSSRSYDSYNDTLGIIPESLVELAEILKENPTYLQGKRVSPQAIQTINLYVEALLQQSDPNL